MNKILKTLIFAVLFTSNFFTAYAKEPLQIPGLNYTLIVPDGFSADANFSGFKNIKNEASITAIELKNSSYEENINGFTSEEYLKSNNMVLEKEYAVGFLPNKKATLFFVNQTVVNRVFSKNIFIFGDEKETVILMGMYPIEYKSIMEESILTSLMSIQYREKEEINPIKDVSFGINVENTNFKFVKHAAGFLYYSVDGFLLTENPNIIIGSSLNRIAIKKQKAYAIKRLKDMLSGQDFTIEKTNSIKIDNLKGYEIIAYIKEDGIKTEMIYQVVLFNKKGEHYIMIGETKQEFEEYIGIFKKIFKTFKK